ncbi:MAG: type II toxin-antitoxin system RelE/ParE family toxin [Proteobacteria bacterium]|nr:type II toxin-antitoxin system RelE/ParE family toxin [Pseudomonadota bacterium]
MISYKVTLKASVTKDFKRLDRMAANRIMKAIELLQKDPSPHQCKKLVGSEHTYRIRVGDYRVIYTVHKQLREVEIQRVRHRKDVYL